MIPGTQIRYDDLLAALEGVRTIEFHLQGQPAEQARLSLEKMIADLTLFAEQEPSQRIRARRQIARLKRLRETF